VTSSSERVFTTSFWLVCTSSLFFFASFNMMIPELPAYLTSLGGADYKGLIISLFTLTAMVSRPFSGKLSDTIGRIPVMVFGVVVCVVCSLAYPILTSVAGFLLLRLVHGFSTGFTPTGQVAFLSDIIPAQRRGEAMGLLGTAGTLGMAGGPAIGGLVAYEFGLDALFYCSAFFALVSIVILFSIRETLAAKQRFELSHLKVGTRDFFEPLVWTPSLVMALTAFAYGTVFTVIPDFGNWVGIKNKGLLFTYITVSSLLVRLAAGRVSDRVGRRPVLLLSTVLMAAALLVVGLANTKGWLIVGVVLYGLAQGSTSPTLLAWATDLSNPQYKGRGVATLYIFMELGIGLGALGGGWLFANDPQNFLVTFASAGVLSTLAFIYLLFRKT
jgi:MFS family permease